MQRLKSFRSWSVRTKLVFAYSTLIFIFVSILSSLSYFSFLRIIREQSFRYTTGIMEQVRNNIDTSIRNIDQASYIIFSNPELLGYLKSTDTLNTLDSWQRYNIIKLMTDVMWSVGGYGGDIFSITLYDQYGNYISTNYTFTPVPFGNLQTLANRGDGKFVWLDIDENLDIVTIVRKIRDMEMKAVGYLRFDVRLKAITGYFSDEIAQLGGIQFILEDGKMVMSDSPNADSFLPSLRAFSDRLMSDESSFILKQKSGDMAVVYTTSRFNNWKYVSVTPLSELIKAAFIIRSITISSSVISILLFSLLSYIIISQFTRPIHQIAEEMKKVQLRGWLPELPYAGNDEISYLTEQFEIMAKRIGKLTDEVLEERSRFHAQQLYSLLSQINPHFLYNTLDIVNWMAREKNIPEISEIVKSLSEMMRYSLKRDNGFVCLSDEIDYVKKYLYIQSCRFVDKFVETFDIPIEYGCVEIPKLILQPIVENSILHGFKSLKRVGHITISVRKDNAILIMSVSDDGNGMEQEKIDALLHETNAPEGEPYHGIGVWNVNRRIKLLYGDEYGLLYKSSSGSGTVCEIHLPLRGGENGFSSI